MCEALDIRHYTINSNSISAQDRLATHGINTLAKKTSIHGSLQPYSLRRGWAVWDLKEAEDRQGQTTTLPSHSDHKLHLRANNMAVMTLISELTATKHSNGSSLIRRVFWETEVTPASFWADKSSCLPQVQYIIQEETDFSMGGVKKAHWHFL